jgi:cytochrome c1
LPNDPQSLALWVRAPEHVVPGTAMPEQPMSERQARDIAAYLYTLR